MFIFKDIWMSSGRTFIDVNYTLIRYSVIIIFHRIHKKPADVVNCTPIVRHHLTIGGAVFLWLNLLLKIN
ncbi:hypothetical protein F7732_04850 [Bacillus mesophilum]|uniref:Uncharacterized protein n=1 Tax=Bacillus mesophilum TaxID=1071718 RepID=A0A7V7RMB2_9BACI|nr:hypothetical protein F7732_04850 [Bacillus mesophilum]